jgi:acetoacetyl-CoA synthetase
MSAPLWQPTAEQVARSNLAAFMRFLAERGRPAMDDYTSLYQWSIAEPAAFWAAAWDFCGVVATRRFDAVVEDFDRMPGARWFPGARLNFAENLLRFRDDRDAIVFADECGRRSSLSYRQLGEIVAHKAQALREWDVGPGDRVVGFLPNIPEAVIAMLAAASLGAVWSSCSPDFGVEGVVDRFGQIQPKVLIAADGYVYVGRRVESLDRVRQIVDRIASIEHVVVVPFLDPPPAKGEHIRGAIEWDRFEPSTVGSNQFEQLPAEHPLYILYSSGTTGPPKCIVHTAGGILLKHLAEHLFHGDLTRDDRLFFFTTTGWMMWNWLVSGLAIGCTVVLYDGSAFTPRPDTLIGLVQRERLTVFGVSPKYLSTIEKLHVEPAKTHDLSSLRAIFSTGSPLNDDHFDYVYRYVKQDVRLSSISGGTDLCGCFVTGNPIGPVYRGELQCRALGVNVQVFDDAGRPVVGRKGELVCTAPFPSMPLGFWNDPSEESDLPADRDKMPTAGLPGPRYRQAYFERFPGIWCHGDYAELTEHGGMVIYGRSDAVLNPGGVRIGTAEIYRQVEQLPEVLESIVVGQDWAGDVRVVLFVKLRDAVVLDDALATRIRDQIRRNATPRHVPAKVLAVTDIPRTRSGKLVELAVRDAVHGRPVRNLEVLANPEALEQFKERPELAE